MAALLCDAVGKLCARSSHAVVLRTLYLAPIIKRFSTTFKFLNTQVVFMYGTPRKILVLTELHLTRWHGFAQERVVSGSDPGMKTCMHGRRKGVGQGPHGF